MGDEQAMISIYKETLRLRDFEISQLSQRNNFFMVFQGALFIGIFSTMVPPSSITLVGCFIGIVASLFQIGMAAGAKYWQERWEMAVERAEENMISVLKATSERRQLVRLFHDDQDVIKKRIKERLESRRNHSLVDKLILLKPSVSRIPIYTGILLLSGWLSSTLYVAYSIN